MQEQIKILMWEVTKVKHRDSDKKQQSPSKNHQENEPETTASPPPTSSPRNYGILPRTTPFFIRKIQKPFRMPLQAIKV